MSRLCICLVLALSLSLTGCSDLSNGDVERIMVDAKVYPLVLEMRVMCNNDKTAREVVDKNLVKDGLVTAKLQHTVEDVGTPLITFTSQALPYLIETDDTLKAFDIQRVKVAEEIFSRVRNIEINPAGTKAVVDYTTQVVNHTPFVALYKQNIEGEQPRRTFFTKDKDRWTWDGKIIRMLP